MPQETKSKAEVGGNHAPSVAGLVAEITHPDMAADVLEQAFDFRGDVTLTLTNGTIASGYLFDRVRAPSPNSPSPRDAFVRLMPPDGPNLTVAYSDVRRIEFSPRDPAAGKSFETWMKKYVEKKLAGERASIESEPLE
ncbi:MAG: hypothetical protein H7Y88_05810 [Phycisphaerales bacterium]|nr:hypothetical protein [Phycisphaerales bacterium]